MERFGHCPHYTDRRMTSPGGDLFAWLDNAITAREEAARAAHATNPAPWTADIAEDTGLLVDSTGNGLWDCESSASLCMTIAASVHAALHDPESVLRRCAADRRTFERHTRYRTVRDMTWMAFGCKHAVRHESRCGYDKQCWPCDDFLDLAEGYGWTEGER